MNRWTFTAIVVASGICLMNAGSVRAADAKIDIAGVSIRIPLPDSSSKRKAEAKNKAIRTRNAKFVRSQVSSLRRLDSLRQWQASNAKRGAEAQSQRRR